MRKQDLHEDSTKKKVIGFYKKIPKFMAKLNKSCFYRLPKVLKIHEKNGIRRSVFSEILRRTPNEMRGTLTGMKLKIYAYF